MGHGRRSREQNQSQLDEREGPLGKENGRMETLRPPLPTQRPVPSLSPARGPERPSSSVNDSVNNLEPMISGDRPRLTPREFRIFKEINVFSS